MFGGLAVRQIEIRQYYFVRNATVVVEIFSWFA